MENENAQGAHKKVSYSRLSCSTWYVVRTYTQTYEQPRYAHMRMLLAVVRTRTHPRSLNFMKKKLIYLFIWALLPSRAINSKHQVSRDDYTWTRASKYNSRRVK